MRCSQEILNLTEYFEMHSKDYPPIRKYSCQNSFSANLPFWIEIANPESFFAVDPFDYFTLDTDPDNDVMLIWDGTNKPFNLDKIQEFCETKNWRCTKRRNVRGSEASLTIHYDLDQFYYEYLTRSKGDLVIITIQENERLVELHCNFCFSFSIQQFK